MTHLVYIRNGKQITAESIVNFTRLIIGKRKGRCWVWKGSRSGASYGSFSWRHEKKHYKSDAHRFSWMIYKGDIPEEKIVCHSCDNKLCVNPDHLWMGSYRENTHDMIKKGRQKIGDHSGEQNGRAQLDWRKVGQIRKRFKKRIVTAQMLSDEYGVKKNVIHMVIQNKTWKTASSGNSSEDQGFH